MAEFYQSGPERSNPFEGDVLLRSYARRKFPRRLWKQLESDYCRLGYRAITDIRKWAEQAEKQLPVHIPFSPWGRRIDRIEVVEGWKQLDRISAEEGFVAIGYERKLGALSRLDQFIRIYLFHPFSANYTCPLAMTDGAARLIELYGDEELKKGAYQHLSSRDPERFWTSGQWMTERTGGSDVSGISTVAKLSDKKGAYRLYGSKWFTSATTSQMAMTLAKIVNDPCPAPSSSSPLSLFYLELRDADGSLQNIRIVRLKDKLGTRALPTAEITFEGTPARLVGQPGSGVKTMSTLFNITRIYNACCSVANMRHIVSIAVDYAAKRAVFGKKLLAHPLHLETLAALEVELEAAFHLTFRVIELLGKEELGQASPEERATLRLLTPLAKLYTAKQAIAVVSEAVEAFGGAGYLEDTGIPRLLRDAQVLSIWEGTTNVLSLDVLRAIERDNALDSFLKEITARIRSTRRAELSSAAQSVASALLRIEDYAQRSGRESGGFRQAGARAFSYALARTMMASLLIEHAQWSLEHERAVRALNVATRWCSQELTPLIFAEPERLRENQELLPGRL